MVKTIFIGVAIFFLSASLLTAQTGHYWTNQFGSKANLLGNSIIGSVDDLGAVFYNPGRLVNQTGPEFVLSANVLQYNQYKYLDPFGMDSEVSSREFVSIPQLVAGTFGLGKRKAKNVIAYSFVNRSYLEIDLDYALAYEPEPNDTVPELDAGSIGMSLRHRLRHQWYSISYAREISESLSVGVTVSGVRMYYAKLSELDLRSLSNQGVVGIFTTTRDFELNRYGLLFKAGISGSKGRVDWGVTVTTPMINLFGKGGYVYEDFFAGVQDPDDNIFTAGTQDELDVTYKLPFSIGAGAGFDFDKLIVHAAVEWFLPVSTYVIMEGDEFTGQSDGELRQFRLETALEHVFNFGVGLEYILNDNFRIYGRFNTDYSAVNEDPDAGFTESSTNLAATAFTPNFYHYGAGVLFNIKKSQITLGLGRSSGSQMQNRPVGIPDEDSDNLDFPTAEGELRWVRWQLLLGFSFKFNNK